MFDFRRSTFDVQSQNMDLHRFLQLLFAVRILVANILINSSVSFKMAVIFSGGSISGIR